MKRILSLVMIFALVMAMFVGCGGEENGIKAAEKMTAQEVYEKVQEASKTMTNTSFLADFNLEMSGLEEMGFAGPMGMTVTGDMKDAENMMMALTVDTGQGMTISGEIYMTDKKMLIHAPLLQQFMGYAYISADLDQLAESTGTPVTQPDPEKVQAILDRFAETTEYSIYDLVKIREEKETVEITVNEEVVETVKLTADIQLDGAEDVLFAFIEFIMSDAEAKELFFSNMTEEQLNEAIAEMNNEEARAEMKAALDAITVNELTVVTYANADYLTVKTEMMVDVDFVDPTTEESMNIKLNGFMDYFNIGGVESIVLPEVAPEEIMNLNDMM
ncbi:hypothetical protein EZV73_06680 [Acidaminobacter sp. JC074]|uniref:hypothetical protein n=1 Tax=Acidaminobacter sp. JC074 TaxID=2530199 RepID=UPI001F0EB829|nr:hypothetical protein [Acidaminobacter sp. JC074]MCH4887248.1 hypothetical protein [Acidaminobacter sp. JC074]